MTHPTAAIGHAISIVLALLVVTTASQHGHALEIDTVPVPAGPFIEGSDRAEREAAYRLDEAAYGHSITRQNKWYESEPARSSVNLPAFHIMRNLVTNALYAGFVNATGHRVPDVDEKTWEGYRIVHPYERTRQFAWLAGMPPTGRVLWRTRSCTETNTSESRVSGEGVFKSSMAATQSSQSSTEDWMP